MKIADLEDILSKYPPEWELRISVDNTSQNDPGLRIFCEGMFLHEYFATDQEVTLCITGEQNYDDTAEEEDLHQDTRSDHE